MSHATGWVSEPTVSVCIPTYRGASFLTESIQSVLDQTYTDFELLIIDDASPDATAGLVARFVDQRLTYIRNESNIGAQDNWNRCLSIARGRYIKILPHDDLLHPTCLERQVAILESDPDERIALACSARNMIDAAGHVVLRRGMPGRIEGRVASSDVVRRCLRAGTNLIGEPGAVLFRRSLADRVGGFDATHPYVIDLDYWFRLLAHGDAWFCAEPLASFRMHRSNWTRDLAARQCADLLGMVDTLAARGTIAVSTLDRQLCRARAQLNQVLRGIAFGLFSATRQR